MTSRSMKVTGFINRFLDKAERWIDKTEGKRKKQITVAAHRRQTDTGKTTIKQHTRTVVVNTAASPKRSTRHPAITKRRQMPSSRSAEAMQYDPNLGLEETMRCPHCGIRWGADTVKKGTYSLGPLLRCWGCLKETHAAYWD